MLTWTTDWQTAVRVVQRAYPGSAGWLLACSSSEGGHGPWVWRGGEPLRVSATGEVLNPHGNVPGGPLQYFQRTFWTDYRAAVADLMGRGYQIPNGSSSWFSMLGQAIAGGWAYGHARPSGKWTGGRC